jgi:hypothetical protein
MYKNATNAVTFQVHIVCDVSGPVRFARYGLVWHCPALVNNTIPCLNATYTIHSKALLIIDVVIVLTVLTSLESLL